MKNKTYHTPGPWTRSDDEPGDIKIVGNGVVVASMDYGAFYDSEADANANLVAAAVDLLGAAKSALRLLSTSWIVSDGARRKGDSGVTGALLRAAIAKAEGRS